jgi:hypothetical protein
MEYARENKFFHAVASLEASQVEILTQVVLTLGGGEVERG